MDKRVLWLIAAIDAAAVAVGIYYYLPQLEQTPWFLWFFVPHSPFYPALAAISITTALAWKWKTPSLDWVASAGMLKYGLWTMLVILWYGDYFLAPAVAAWFALLFLLHVGGAAEGIAFSFKARFDAGKLPLVLGWFLAGDLLDYGLGSLSTPPLLPVDSRLQLLALATVGLSVACVACTLWLSSNKAQARKLFPFIPDLFNAK